MHGGFLLYRPLTLWVTPPRLHSAASRLCHYNMRFQRMGTISRRHFVRPIPICIFDAWGLPLVSPPHLMGNAPSFTLGGKSIVPLQYAFSTHGHNLSAAFRPPHSNMHLRCMGASSYSKFIHIAAYLLIQLNKQQRYDYQYDGQCRTKGPVISTLKLSLYEISDNI